MWREPQALVQALVFLFVEWRMPSRDTVRNIGHSNIKNIGFLMFLSACLLFASAPSWSAQVACTPVGSVPTGQSFGGRAFNRCYQMTYSGADQVVNIKANTYVSAKLWGAAGGTGIYANRGGAGGFAQGDFVADGRPLTLVVGQGGGLQDQTPGITGYGGGGRNFGPAYYANWGGGLAGIFYNGSPFGSSYLQINAAATPILVAGGGGSGSGSAWSTGAGSGGGLAGQDAFRFYVGEYSESFCRDPGVYRDPTGGTQAAGGIAGLDIQYFSDNPPGGNGTQWWGGTGGTTTDNMPGEGTSAGGGAGYYGGGGGSPSWYCDDAAAAGGSGYISPTLVRPGTGQFDMSLNAYDFSGLWIPYVAPHSNDVHYISGVAFSGRGLTSWTRGGDGLVVLQYYEQPAFPSLTIKKISNGGTGSFVFKGTTKANGFSTDNSYTINTTTAGAVVSGAPVTLSANNVQTEVQETSTASWAITSASCVDGNAANSGNPAPPTTFGTLVGNTLQIPATNVRAYADLQCTFTNSLAATAPTLTVTERAIVTAPATFNPPETFVYTGNNGWTPQSNSSIKVNTVTTGATQNLAALNVATTLTVAVPTVERGWRIASIQCTDTNAAVSKNPSPPALVASSTSNMVTIPANYVVNNAKLQCAVFASRQI